jgi:NodT family efflux transporter outer membrane factor (OMF) lipoprotein
MRARLRRERFLALTLWGASMAGCAVGPDYALPELARPASLAPASPDSNEPAAIRFTTEAPLESWWRVFRDPVLDGLVERARKNNPGLLAAIARVQAARAVSRQATAPLFPSIEASSSYAFERASREGSGIPAPRDASLFRGTDFFQGTADMAYELDLWGRIRRSVESARAELAASDEDRKNAEITLVADVAQTYFDLGAAEARLVIALDAVEERRETLSLLRSRGQLGVATDLDVSRAEGELESASAEVPDARRERATAEHRLAILLGEAPDVWFSGREPAAFELPPEVPVGLPSTLLERRPDVRRAEAKLVAANARVGVAKAEYFPKVTIAGNVGASALDAGKLARAGARLWSVGPQISVPIFEGGRIQAGVLEAEALTSEAEQLYRETVLQAFAEVADAVFSLDARREARDREAATVVAQERARSLADSQFRGGLVDYLVVLDAQRQLLQSRNALVRARRDLLGELVRLEKALGGGWT